MKNRRSLLAVVLTLAMLLTGCGAKLSRGESGAPVANDSAAGTDQELNGNFSMTTDKTESATEEGDTVYRDPDAKLIREARLRIQTTEFDQAAAELEKLVAAAGGYFENASLQGGSYLNVNANRSGEYIIRIPAEQYDAFLRQTGNFGYVTYRNESTENIGEQYYDTQSRLKTQKTKQERLLALLAKADNMEAIIDLENALSEVEYEIELLSSTINRYDSLVDFSTIYLTLDEVHKVTEETGVANSLGQRMARGFTSSLEGLVDGFQDVLVWFSYNVFGLLSAGAVLGVSVGITYRKFRKKKAEAFDQENKAE